MATDFLARRLAGQLALPRGLAGTLLGHAMDRANRRCTALSIEMLAPETGERVLDAGCGTGKALAEVRRIADCSLSGIDPSPTMIAAARRRLGIRAELACARIEDLSDRVMHFDGLLALNVLYFAQPGGAMTQALFRRLAPGGRLIAYVTHRDTMATWPFVRAGLHRLYDADELAALLVDGGFAPNNVSVQEREIVAGVRGLFARAVR